MIYQEADGNRLALTATYDPSDDNTTQAFAIEGDGDAVAIPVEGLHQRCPVRIYSWSEIETLGREHDRQRDLIDRLVPNLDHYKNRRNELRNALVSSSATIIDIVRRMSELLAVNGGALRRYLELKTTFERLNTPALSQRFEQLDLARRQVEVLQAAIRSLLAAMERVDSISSPTNESLWDRGVIPPTDELRAWWDQDVTPALGLPELAGKIEAAKLSIQESLTNRVRTLETLLGEAQRRVSAEESAIREETGADTQQAIQADQREQSRTRYERSQQIRNEYMELFRQFESSMAARRQQITQLRESQFVITGARNSYRDTLVGKLAEFEQLEISIDLKGGYDRKLLVAFMRDGDFLTRNHFGNYKQQKVAERCARMATPLTIAQAILSNQHELLLGEGREWATQETLSEAEGKALVEAYHPYERDETGDVPLIDGSKLEQIFAMEQTPWDDAVTILLGGRAVDQLSPGQRSSAMLPLIALAEVVPLVIDQPEDNLDNRLVGQTLTKILAKLKEHRQIIVATHSPNIVVGGDAEQVVVMESPAQREAVVQHMGSIDDSDIIHSVVGIMEGGREAFELREKRYGFT